MNKILIVARKEIKELMRSRTTLILGLAFAAFFSITYSQGISRTGAISLDSTVFYLSLSIAIFMAYISTGQLFLLEKRDGVIETLMCAPLSLRQIWAGKTAAGVVPSCIISLFSIMLLITLSSIQSGTVLIPGAAIIFHVLITVPTFIAAFTGLVGFGQLLLGMRENRLLNFLLFVPAFGALYGSGFAVATGIIISWQYVAILFGFSLVLLGTATYLTRHLSRERITTTIA